jgi:hypothetical protein
MVWAHFAGRPSVHWNQYRYTGSQGQGSLQNRIPVYFERTCPAQMVRSLDRTLATSGFLLGRRLATVRGEVQLGDNLLNLSSASST